LVRLDSIGIADDWPQTAEWLEKRLERLKPNLVLLGAMSVSLRGTLAAARVIRRSGSANALVVLGGKHVTETMWIENGQPRIHRGAPILADSAGDLDLFVSGDGEDVIAELGEGLVEGISNDAGQNLGIMALQFAQQRLLNARGDWAIFWRQEGTLKWLHGRGLGLRPDDYPLVYDAYPINAHFPVLGRAHTAHAYSYTSKGCLFRCYFCSESADINGPVRGLDMAGRRLASQMLRLAEIARACGKVPLSVFVEDSIFLQGAPRALRDFSEEMGRLKPDVRFGAQFTIDMILDPARQALICELAKHGLSYVFIGLETTDEAIVAEMSKNRPSKDGKSRTWLARFEEAMSFLIANDINIGVSMLFGLGENQNARLTMLEQIKVWQDTFREPCVVSLNWAVKHPMRALSDPTPYDYTRWPVESGDPRLPVIQRLFGEASTNFRLPATDMPSLEHLHEIETAFSRIRSDI